MLGPEIVTKVDHDWIKKIQLSLQNDKNARKREIRGSGLLSDLFDQKILSHFEGLFNESDRNGSLACSDFKNMIRPYIADHVVDNIYRAIDVNDTGYVTYSEFTNFLIAAEAGSSHSAKNSGSRLVMTAQQEEGSSANHHDFIDHMTYSTKPCPMLITGGRDGQVALWNPTDLQLIKIIPHKDKSTVFNEEQARSKAKDFSSTQSNGCFGKRGKISSVCCLIFFCFLFCQNRSFFMSITV
jgi:hypothetical protein